MQQLRIAVLSNTAEINTEEKKGIHVNGNARAIYGFTGDDLKVLKDLSYRLAALEDSPYVAQFFEDVYKLAQEKHWKEKDAE